MFGIWNHEFARWARESDFAQRHPVGAGMRLEVDFDTGERHAYQLKGMHGSNFEVFPLPAGEEIELVNGERRPLAECA